MSAAPPPAVESALRSFARGRAVLSLEPMPGNAGFSYGFEIDGEGFVLRVPPPGVAAEGPADVLRQARLLRLLAATAVPVPPVRGVGPAGEPWFVVDRLKARTIRPTGGSSAFDPAAARELAVLSVDALAALHGLPAPAWLGPAPAPGADAVAAGSVTRWDRFASRAADPSLLRGADELRRRLIEAAPRDAALGIVHGDYQWGNVLGIVEGTTPRLAAVIDWELAQVGPVLDDLGWLCLFSDGDWWHGDAMVIPAGVPSPDELVARYGGDPAAVEWHLARAAYVFAVIIGFNLMLHRRGKRHDPYWEELGPSAPVMIGRALARLG